MPMFPPGGDDDDPEDDASRAARARKFLSVSLEFADLDEVYRNIGRALSAFGGSGALDGPARRKDFWDRLFALLDRAYDYTEKLRDRTLN